jgi:hypothetical protein
MPSAARPSSEPSTPSRPSEGSATSARSAPDARNPPPPMCQRCVDFLGFQLAPPPSCSSSFAVLSRASGRHLAATRRQRSMHSSPRARDLVGIVGGSSVPGTGLEPATPERRSPRMTGGLTVN